MLSRIGFEEIHIQPKEGSDEIIRGWNVFEHAEKAVFSGYIRAVKPMEVIG